MAADVLEDEAHRRAVEGLKSYKFNKDGIPLRHPERCECGHHMRHHPKLALGGDSLASKDDEEKPQRSLATACIKEECGCGAFVGAPYFEHTYADTLLIFLTKGALPERYRELKEVRGVLANLDLNLLPNHLVARVAAGEPIEAVLAAGASDAGLTPGEIVRGALAPGKDDGDAPEKP